MHISGLGLVEIVKNLNKNELVGLEIGCSLGVTTKHLLSNLPNLKLYGIDPYISYVDWNGGSDTNEDQENYLEIFIESIEPYKNRHYLYRDLSDNVMDEFEDDSLDFIFIDGLHTYEQVLKDCRNYYSKVKSGGIFSGHDYRVISGVNKAVNEFSSEVSINQIYETQNDVWYWFKP
jgi:predicted O-methyltransferase YrrM